MREGGWRGDPVRALKMQKGLMAEVGGGLMGGRMEGEQGGKQANAGVGAAYLGGRREGGGSRDKK